MYIQHANSVVFGHFCLTLLKTVKYTGHKMRFIFFLQLLFETVFIQINIYAIMTDECAEMHTEYVSNKSPQYHIS
jgi:hypothetical protein